MEDASARSDARSKALRLDPIARRLKRTLAAGMIKRFFALALLLLVGSALGSCTNFAGTVSDYWPTWAGGMPKDVPPRPGAPGYEEFVAHQQGKDVSPSVAPADKANASGAPSGDHAPNDAAAVEGGLY
jgi:hypothetical protein